MVQRIKDVTNTWSCLLVLVDPQQPSAAHAVRCAKKRARPWFDFDWFVFYWIWIYMFCHVLPEATKNGIHWEKKTTIPKGKDLKFLKSWVVYSTKRSLTSSKSSPEAFSCPKNNDSTNGVILLRFEQIEWEKILHQIQQTQCEQMFGQVSGNTCSEMVCFQVCAQNEGSSKIEHFGALYWVSRNLRHPQMHVDIKPLSRPTTDIQCPTEPPDVISDWIFTHSKYQVVVDKLPPQNHHKPNSGLRTRPRCTVIGSPGNFNWNSVS